MKKYFDKLYTNTSERFYRDLHTWLKKDKKKFIITANPETFMVANTNKLLNDAILDKKTIVVADGIGLVKASKKYKINCSKIIGVDVASKLLEYGNELHKKVYLFGAHEEVVRALINKLNKEYNNLEVVGYSNGYGKDKDNEFSNIAKLEPDIILVALGIPMQEELIYRHLNEFNKGIFVGIGGTFDVLSGMKKRAPKFFQKLNIEWLYRILKEPKRIKRFYNSNVKFIFKVYFGKEK